MSCNSELRPRNGKTNEIGQSFLLFLLLAAVLSTSAGYSRQPSSQLPFIGNSPVTYEPVGTSITGNIPEALVASGASLRPLAAISRPVRRDPYVSDTCGGTVNVPLSFDRLLPYKSTHFPSRRDYPMLCVWNFTVKHEACSLARMTMRVDGRSRLPDVDGCSKGYYTVSPNMKGARICGHIGDVPAFWWYVDAYQPESGVTVVTMKNLGINDGFSEGLSFTLQGECVDYESAYAERTNVEKENARLNRRWMNRVMEDYLVGEGPRIVVKPSPKLPAVTSSPPANGSTKLGHPVVSYDNNGIPWLNLKSPSDLSPEIHQKLASATFKSSASSQVVNETNQEIISSHSEYPATTSLPLESTTEPEEENSSTWPATGPSNNTDKFDLTTSVVMATTDNDVLSTTLPTVDPLTTPSSTTEIRTTLMESSTLPEVAPTTTEQPPIVLSNVVANSVTHNVSGQKFAQNKFQTFQRRFLKFLKLFSL